MSTTKSAIIKLTTPITWDIGSVTGTGTGINYWPVAFSPNGINGWADYTSTYSQFRIVKARGTIFRAESVQSCECIDNEGNKEYNCSLALRHGFAFASSRQFFQGTPYTTSSIQGLNSIVPLQTLNALRQGRWYKERFPNQQVNHVNFAFRPWYCTATNGPIAFQGNTLANFSAPRSASRWMPVYWGAQFPISFFGPYIAAITPEQTPYIEYSARSPKTTWTGKLTLYLQFRGQK